MKAAKRFFSGLIIVREGEEEAMCHSQFCTDQLFLSLHFLAEIDQVGPVRYSD